MIDTKIIFIQPKFAHYRYGLFDELNNHLDVTFVFLKKDASKSEYKYVSTVDVNPNWKTVYIDSDKNRFWLFSLYKLVRKIKPQAIVASIPGTPQTILAAWLRVFHKIPFVLYTLNWNNYRNENNNWLKKKTNDWKRSFVTKKADSIVCGGSNSKNYYLHLGVSDDKLFVAYQSTADMAKKHLGQNKRIEGDKLKLLFFSRLVRSKGVDVLIYSFKRLQEKFDNLELIIVGDGDSKAFCEELVVKEKINHVQFVGSVANEKAIEYYSDADVFVLPCNGYKRGEAWGLVLNEAASMSLPIVTTDVVGAKNDLVVNGVNGYIVEHNNIDQLTEALDKILSDESSRENMGKESRKLFEKINSYENNRIAFCNAIDFAINNGK